MTFNIAQFKESLKAMSPDERRAAENKLLADYARHAAFGRPLASAGLSRVFVVAAGMEENALAEDADIVSIRSLEHFKAALENRGHPLLLVRTGTDIAEQQIYDLLETCVAEKTVFIAR